MMQPIDPLSQLALCCGLGGRRRGYKDTRGYFYSPSTAHLSTGNGWPIQNQFNPHAQPYILLTQPVIVAGNPTSSQTNTMTLVQHAQSATNTGVFPTALSIIGAQTVPHQQQPSIVSSQYAIYNSSTALGVTIPNIPTSTNIYGTQQSCVTDQNRNNSYMFNKNLPKPLLEAVTPQQTDQRPVTLNSEVFRQLEVIEKQVNLSNDMVLIERHGIVITRALDPHSLVPHLTEATLRRYHEHFLFNDNYVIRFIEIIKRPGQTLGLYIRTVHFENPRNRCTRPGLVITKIDTDSPVYNSQVLNVGDEILSINLVDIEGMSLDDVVIIMSIPKRLVLALRIPKDRDQLINAHLLQQHYSRNSINQHQNQINTYQKRAQAESSSNEQIVVAQQPSIKPGSHIVNKHESGLPFNSNQIDKLRREANRRIIEYDQELYPTRPVRVQSALDMSNTLHGGVLSDEHQCRDNYEINQPRCYSSSGDWPEQSFDLQSSIVLNDDPEPRSIDRVNRREISSKSTGDAIAMSNDEFSDGFDPDVNTLEPTILDKERLSLMEGNQNLYSSESILNPISSTLPRRTLPTRPNIALSPTLSAKQPVISNLRLGDTPEQSSYFSSSIDAINRELKELRRQRMALTTNENNADSTRD